jgi:selenocysteine-specific elongation factor
MAAEQAAADALLPLLESQGLAPETVSELSAETGTDVGIARKVLGELARDGRIVRISSELHFSAGAMARARESLTAYLRAHPTGASAGELRDALGVSRKYAIPLLEYFDAQGLTKRDGDVRVLRSS